jgi:hypothetical protein
MRALPTVEAYLKVEAHPVRIEESGPGAPCALTRRLAAAATWVHVEPREGPAPRTLSLHGPSPHGAIRFVGELENRMVEPLVLTLRALGTGKFDLDTPATPVFLRDLQQPVHLLLVVSVSCPFCPASTAVALRLACVSDKVHIDVVRADVPGAPRVHAVPTLLHGPRVVASGQIHEMALVEALLR